MKIQRSLGYLGALIIGGLIVYSLRSFYIDRIRGEKKTTRISHVDRKDILYDKLQTHVMFVSGKTLLFSKASFSYHTFHDRLGKKQLAS